MAGAHLLKEDTRDMEKLYNQIPLDQLSTVMPGFDWQSFRDETAITGIDGLVVGQLDYMKALDGMLADTDMATWKLFLQWGLINATADRLSSELDAANFDFYGLTLNGQQEQRPDWRRGVAPADGLLGEAVGKIYVDRH
ncbi:MAG: hypothetical protein ACO280_06030 [Pseudohongiellaceae bacterium]